MNVDPQKMCAIDQAPELCASCRRLDFDAIMFPPRISISPNGLYISTIEKLNASSSCPSCQLFSSVAISDQHFDYEQYHLRIFPGKKVLGATEVPGGGPPLIALAILPGPVKSREAHLLKTGNPGWAFILARRKNDRRLLDAAAVIACAVRPLTVDFNRLTMWLHRCEHAHVETCSARREARDFTVPLRCIDCISRRVVAIPDEDEYLALSYVWGNVAASATPNLSNIGELPAKASQVIEDAIVVVKSLGKRYLWVDQYCIDQFNHDFKRIQIREMDRIYAGAYATVVACAGSHAEYGLPGISRKRLYHQHSAVIDDIELYSTLPPLSYAIKDSVWTKRGWTYQEAILSRRCILFTEYQTYFVCQDMECRESMSGCQKSEGQRSGEVNKLDVLDTDIFPGAHRTPFGTLFRKLTNHMSEFSKRTLRYEADMLDAFRGLLARSPFYTFYGIPIAREDNGGGLDSRINFDIGFARGLCWNVPCTEWTREAVTRRREFPSWSWVGWQGHVQWFSDRLFSGIGLGAHFLDVEEKSFTTKFWLEDTKGNSLTFPDVVADLHDSRIIPENYNLIVEAVICSVQFARCQGLADYYIGKSIHDADVRGDAVLLEDVNKRPGLKHRLTTESFDCMLLYPTTKTPLSYQNFLILSWEGNIAHRIGFLQFPGNKRVVNDLKRKKFRLA